MGHSANCQHSHWAVSRQCWQKPPAFAPYLSVRRFLWGSSICKEWKRAEGGISLLSKGASQRILVQFEEESATLSRLSDSSTSQARNSWRSNARHCVDVSRWRGLGKRIRGNKESGIDTMQPLQYPLLLLPYNQLVSTSRTICSLCNLCIIHCKMSDTFIFNPTSHTVGSASCQTGWTVFINILHVDGSAAQPSRHQKYK